MNTSIMDQSPLQKYAVSLDSIFLLVEGRDEKDAAKKAIESFINKLEQDDVKFGCVVTNSLTGNKTRHNPQVTKKIKSTPI